MRFIGGKSLLLDEIDKVIAENVKTDVNIVGDLFSGSAVVSQFMKRKGYSVVSNDIMYMSYVLARGSLELNSEPLFADLKITNVFDYLNELTEPRDLEKAFIFNNYSPNSNCDRMYFQEKNAKKIDAIRQEIQIWFDNKEITEAEFYYLLACLISAAPYVANITGVYAAYLKHWDKRTYNDLLIEPLPVIKSQKKCKFYNEDAVLLSKKEKFDLAYIDTPYNQRQYTPNYHILETIARYDNPTIHGITGLREYDRSDFCVKAKVEGAFISLFDSLSTDYAIVSYNNEGLLSTETLLKIFDTYGKVKLYEYPYRRYKSKIPNNKKGLKEQIYFIDMR